MISKKTHFVMALALSLALTGMQGCTGMKSEDDNVIIDNVKSKLAADSTLSTANIDVDANNGVVTLSGTVDNAAQEQAAIKDASSVAGVKNVQSQLVIGGAGGTGGTGGTTGAGGTTGTTETGTGTGATGTGATTGTGTTGTTGTGTGTTGTGTMGTGTGTGTTGTGTGTTGTGTTGTGTQGTGTSTQSYIQGTQGDQGSPQSSIDIGRAQGTMLGQSDQSGTVTPGNPGTSPTGAPASDNGMNPGSTTNPSTTSSGSSSDAQQTANPGTDSGSPQSSINSSSQPLMHQIPDGPQD